jgi:hypothetical protein
VAAYQAGGLRPSATLLDTPRCAPLLRMDKQKIVAEFPKSNYPYFQSPPNFLWTFTVLEKKVCSLKMICHFQTIVTSKRMILKGRGWSHSLHLIQLFKKKIDL